jgi:hypothetical protein
VVVKFDFYLVLVKILGLVGENVLKTATCRVLPERTCLSLEEIGHGKEVVVDARAQMVAQVKGLENVCQTLAGLEEFAACPVSAAASLAEERMKVVVDASDSCHVVDQEVKVVDPLAQQKAVEMMNQIHPTWLMLTQMNVAVVLVLQHQVYSAVLLTVVSTAVPLPSVPSTVVHSVSLRASFHELFSLVQLSVFCSQPQSSEFLSEDHPLVLCTNGPYSQTP